MSDQRMPTHHGVETSVEGSFSNKTMQLLYQRKSCRRFQQKKIPPKLLEQVLGVGVHAPSGGNLQNVSIVKVEDQERRQRLMGALGNQRFIGEAPVNLVFCLDLRRNKRWAELEIAPFTANCTLGFFLMGVQETGIVAQNICTAADSAGLGSCYVGNVLWATKAVSAILELPKYVFPTVLLSLGYSSDNRSQTKKHRLGTILHSETYRDLNDEDLLAACKEKWTEEGYRRIELTEGRLEVLYSTCEKVHGREFAEKSVARARMQGYISPVQRYFGLHYRADWVLMSGGNSGFMKVIEESGFDCFRDYLPE